MSGAVIVSFALAAVGFFSYLDGTLLMAVALVVTRCARPGSAAFARVEAVSWTGGALGGIYVAISIFALPRLGVAFLLALIVVGQITASLAFD